MKKLIIVFGLLVASPVFAMEQLDIMSITPELAGNFFKHFSMALGGCKRKVAEKTYAEDNSICLILADLSSDLHKFDNDVTRLIQTDFSLNESIDNYRSVDSNLVIARALEQVRSNQGDVKKAKELVIQNRRVLAELKLQERHPAYSLSLIGEIDTKEREKFMQRNAGYPMNDGAKLDYKALFIYLTLLADHVE